MFTFCPFILLPNRNRTSGMYNKPLTPGLSDKIRVSKARNSSRPQLNERKCKYALSSDTATVYQGTLHLPYRSGCRETAASNAKSTAPHCYWQPCLSKPSAAQNRSQTVSWLPLPCQALNSVQYFGP